MDKKQTIKCNVETCKYNDCNNSVCELQQIMVEACPGCSSGLAVDESMCGSYKCKCNE